MQDRYSGDIGDFGKFQLLRVLLKDETLSLAQIWYMYPNESHNNDGLYINYFEKVKGFDPFLEEKLKAVSLKKNRKVKDLENSKLLKNTSYFSKPVKKQKESLEYRKNYLKEALEFSYKKNIIACDPDNGIATKFDKESRSFKLLTFDSFLKRTKQGKYIFLDELKEYYKSVGSLIIYHHLNRLLKHDEQIKLLLIELKKEFVNVLAIKHKPYSPRVFFLINKNKSLSDSFLKKMKSLEGEYPLHWQVFI